MKTINCEITGVAPLLQNRFPMETMGASRSRAIKKNYDPETEAKKCLYINEGTIYEPSEHVFQSMVRVASDFQFSGKKTFKDVVATCVDVLPEKIPLILEKPYEIDCRPVVIQKARVLKYRPKFNQWKLKFQILILDETNLSPVTLKEILEKAGATKGIGDYRPRFGRFMVTEFKVN